MMRLILVKHAMPAIDEAKPSKDWPISDDGRAAAARLADALAHLGPFNVAASTEPKAADTGRVLAERLGAPIAFDDDLVEQKRETVGWLSRADIEAAIERMFREPDTLVYGEETANQALARFSRGVERHQAVGGDATLVVAAHGTVVTLWTAARFQQDPMPLWRSLTLPSALVFEGDTPPRLVQI